MLRHRAANASTVDAWLLVSARSLEDVFYRDELKSLAAAAGLTFTRNPPSGIFVCGPTAFVRRSADVLARLGHDRTTIRVEDFGGTGG